ncbi:MAG: VOC family protein, partial [Steroidobacteraceae bacterium]
MTQPAAPLDPMTPRQDGRPVLCGPLSGLVLASDDLERCRRFYGGALDLRVDRQHLAGEPARKLRDHWG